MNRKRSCVLLRMLAWICMLPVLLSASACLKPVDIDSCGYVTAMGFDSGKNKKFEFTLVLQRGSSGDAGENNGGAIILSTEAEDIFDAINILSSSIAYNLNFTRTHVLVFGEKTAREGRIPELLSFSFDTLRIRSSALMMITHSSVRDYFGGIAANNSANIAKLQDDIMSDVLKTGEIAAMNAALFYEAISDQRFDAVLPLGFFDENVITDTKQKDTANKGEDPVKDAEPGERIGGMQSSLFGCALFSGAAMTGTLNRTETQLMNMGRGDFVQGSMLIRDPDGESASVFLMLNERKVKIDLCGEEKASNGNGGCSASIHLSVDAVLLRDDCGMFSGESAAAALENTLCKALNDVFISCRDCGCDAFGFGRDASMLFHYAEEFERFDWKKAYAGLVPEFTVSVDLSNGEGFCDTYTE